MSVVLSVVTVLETANVTAEDLRVSTSVNKPTVLSPHVDQAPLPSPPLPPSPPS